MKSVTLPIVGDKGSKMTFFIGAGHLAVVDSIKEPGTCRLVDGMHNNGGWPIAMTRDALVKLINGAK